MSKKAFDKIMAGLTDALDIVEGRADPAASRVHIPAQIDTRAIRAKMRLSQVQFADRFGLSAAAVRDWEQGRRVSEAGSRAFLRVLSKDPEAVERAPARGVTAPTSGAQSIRWSVRFSAAPTHTPVKATALASPRALTLRMRSRRSTDYLLNLRLQA